MAITTAICTSYKQELFEAVHDHQAAGNSFKCALYTSSATLSAATTAYTATNEHAASGGYTATGSALTVTNSPATSGTTAYCDFDDETWSASTITARGCMVYNDTAAGDPAVFVYDFGADKSSSAGDFIVQFPAFDSTNAILRIV